ncbi:MAG: protein kinase [Pyrinomonadaceae bacterium]
MKPERWQLIKGLLEAALDREPADRPAFLDEACQGDTSLRQQVNSFIISHEQASGFIEEPAFEVMAESLENNQAEVVGRTLGHYKILETIGRGGMGEVYRARDTRLGRDVAIKVLPRAFSTDADRLRRFEQEARAASALNHPHILVIHDVGTENGSPYMVTELLQGETLRQRLDTTAIPVRKAIDYSLQIARGLAAAHDRGIIHRDLKPQNLFITRDGQLKILDFGLAKLIQPAIPLQTEAPTMLAGADTASGMVMGTAAYMSPEQVRGQAADHRSDIFSFGAVLYEMLRGKPAFRGDSPIETMNAILKEEPAELSEANRTIPAGLERVVSHCLEKDPNERFQSARDMAFDLEAISSPSSANAAAAALATAPTKLRRLLPLFMGLVLFTALGFAAFYAGRRAARTSAPSFQRLTYRRGFIRAARFAPDGRTIIYGADWDGNHLQLFSMSPESPESRPLGLSDTDLLAVSSSGEMAVSLGHHVVQPFIYSGTLARMPLAGAAPREILEDVQCADWSPDGVSLAIVRDVGGTNRLEFPVGNVLYETTGWIGDLRVSPKGDRVGFLDHTIRRDDGGSIAVVDRTGIKKTLSTGWRSERGLAWSPAGDEIWFTATKAGGNRALYGVTLAGQERLITQVAGALTLNDVSRDGRVLVTHDYERLSINYLPPGGTKERDLSWLDWSVARDLSDDGQTLLIGETGGGGGATYACYLRKTDGSPAVRLGDGSPLALSPDGKWVIASIPRNSLRELTLLPTGAGEAKPMTSGVVPQAAARWLPGGQRFLFAGSEPGHGVRFYVQDLAGGAPRAITPDGVSTFGVTTSPDGKFFTTMAPDKRIWIYPVDRGEPRQVLGLSAGDEPLGWAADGHSLYVYRRGELPARIYRLDLSTERKELWREVMPSDPAGIEFLTAPKITPDGKSYAYSYYRNLSDLYLIEGLK